MDTMQVMNTEPAPHAGGEAPRQDDARDDPEAVERRADALGDDDEQTEESGYGYGV